MSERTGLDFATLDAAFRESVAQMRVDGRLLDLARKLREAGVSIGIVTGRHGRVPRDRRPSECSGPGVPGHSQLVRLRLPEGARRTAGCSTSRWRCLAGQGDFGRAMLVDDSARSRAAFRDKGGHVYPYRDFVEFRPWADACFHIY